MLFLSLIKLASQSLRTNKIRSLLTVLGIMIGIASVIVVFGAGAGIRAYINDQLSFFGNDILWVEVKVPNTAHVSSENAMGVAEGIAITTLTREDMEAIKKIPNVANAYSSVMGQSLVSYKGETKQVFLMGSTYEVQDIDSGKIVSGRYYTFEEEKSLARVAILGWEIKDELFGSEEAIGQMVKIKNLSFRVIGIMEKRGASGPMNMDEQIFIPLKTLQRQIMGINHVSYIMIKYQNVDLVDQTAEDIRILLRSRHEIDQSNPDKDDFSVVTQEEAMSMMDKILGGIQLLLIALASISLLVGGIGIMNIMYVTVSERTYEIGLRKAVGATSSDIMWHFLLESLVVTLAGGVIGIILGTLIILFISLIAQSMGIFWPFSVPFSGVSISVIFSLAIGLIFGLYPAKKAANLDPIVALQKK